jgi:2-polyprenyl-3-methyl-5-hydroxy-6-metoxy-1,4-benzoquinol methylase
MHSEVEEKLAHSLSASTTKLIPYLPYLLQDLWALGSIPEDVVAILKAHTDLSSGSKVLDLACGKGAVGVGIAGAIGCRVKGIDLMEAFVEEATRQAEVRGVSELCSFSIEDIQKSVARERNYDLVFYGAAGDVLGSPAEILEKLKDVVRPGGYIMLDDAYIQESMEGSGEATWPTRADWLQIIEAAGLTLAAEKTTDPGVMAAVNRTNQACIVRRANELISLYPDKKALFEGYIQSQQDEIEQFEGEMVGVTWLLRKMPE